MKPKKRILSGKKIAVLVETEYIPDEINKYKKFFGNLGAEVELLTGTDTCKRCNGIRENARNVNGQ